VTFVVTARVGSQVRRERHATLDEALDAIAGYVGGVGRAPARTALGRAYEPSAQVAGRFELRGPRGLRAGVDVRGDGSAVAYTGWIRKRPIEPEGRETAVQALRRALSA
jgi:hypothetical protein